MVFSEDLRNFLNANFNIWSSLFWLRQRRELAKYRDYFDTIESKPLTNLQRRAVILDERRNLVVAGAGTGKTSTIVAKVGYLLKSGRCKADEILLLAFNRDARNELASRCLGRLGVEIQASTFHELGTRIIADVEGRKPAISVLATDKARFDEFLQDAIRELQNDPNTWKRLKSFVIGHLRPYRPENQFSTLSDYVAFVRSVELRALSNDLVKSHAELDIANFLFLKGVRFEYEARYPYISFGYRPDFFLPDHNVYIEHFGIDRLGRTAPYIDSTRYNEDMVRKRQIHAEYGTRLLETYSWERSEGVLLEHLHRKLRDSGVKYAPVLDEEIVARLDKLGFVSVLGNLISTFLGHFKSNQLTASQLRTRISEQHADARTLAFFDVFCHVYAKYEAVLSGQPREVDFHDMISQATTYVAEGKFKPSWKYIIVDEFQDISNGRCGLLKAILKRDRKTRFFAVGDDWQSIYRFADSEVSIMRNFRDFFGRAVVVKLDRTFRFNDKIEEVSSKFIQRNPDQLRKKLTTVTQATGPQVFVHWTRPDGSGRYDASLMNTIQRISKHSPSGSLLILGRYNHLLPRPEHLRELKNQWPGELLEPRSIHRAKGLEADYVVLLALSANEYGFPSEIEDDPLLQLVLSEMESYPHAEERRLLYVGITRARHQAHIISDRVHSSAFAQELVAGYSVSHVGLDERRSVNCPECRSGIIREINPTLRACSNYPYCDYVAPRCSVCGNGFLMLHADRDRPIYKCTDERCDGSALACPRCGIGALIRTRGRNGDFFGCHSWPRCDYTRGVDDAGRIRAWRHDRS